MIPTQFAYLLSDQALTKVSADRLETLAKLAAKAYVESGVALNESIGKMASENDLNPHQIERVCEMANIDTHRTLWSKTAAKHEVHFVLADAKKLVKRAATTVAKGNPMTSSEYNSPPKLASAKTSSVMSKIASTSKTSGHDGFYNVTTKQQVQTALIKKAAERDRARSKTLADGIQLEAMTKEAFKAVKQAVLGGASFQDIYIACDAVGMGKFANEFLETFEKQLIGETYGSTRIRLEKLAIGKVPESWLSEGPARSALTVVNGAHPVLISLDTLAKQTDQVEQGLIGYLRLNDEVKIYEQKLKELQ